MCRSNEARVAAPVVNRNDHWLQCENHQWMCDLIGKKTVPIGPRWAGWVYPGAMKMVETEGGTYRQPS